MEALRDRFVTDRVLLRPLRLSDAAAVFESYAADAEVTRYLTWTPHRAVAQTEAYLAGCLATSACSARTYALMGRSDGILHGAFDLRRPSPHRLEFGMVLARRSWGLGLMTGSLRAVAAWAMAQPEIWRIGAVCDVENGASARVMQKAGLLQEGMLRRWAVHPNLSRAPRDCLAFARSRAP